MRKKEALSLLYEASNAISISIELNNKLTQQLADTRGLIKEANERTSMERDLRNMESRLYHNMHNRYNKLKKTVVRVFKENKSLKLENESLKEEILEYMCEKAILGIE